MKSIKEIEEEAKALGLSPQEICKRAGIKRDTWQRWKRKFPKTLQMYKDLLETLEVETLRKDMGLK
jgi:hypothetical protein